jgi:hypothetical protein
VRDPGRVWWSEATASTMDATLDTHTFTMADDCWLLLLLLLRTSRA